MRILHIGGRIVPVPTQETAGTERVLVPLLEQQAALGHDVTLLTCEGSFIAGVNCVSLAPARRNLTYEDYVGQTVCQASDAFAYLQDHANVDVVHDHTGFFAPFANFLNKPVVATLHNGLRQVAIFGRLPVQNYHMVAISESEEQILSVAGVPIFGWVHHDVDTSSLLSVELEPPINKFCWIGRMSPDKGPDLAIQIAIRLGFDLYLAGPAPQQDHLEWFQAEVEPYLDLPNIHYVGSITDADKPAFFAGAVGLLVPNRCYESEYGPAWFECFGLVILEALAMGVPVYGTKAGSLVELAEEAGVGILIPAESDQDVVERLALAIELAPRPSQLSCRERAAAFLPGPAARRYLEIYERVISA
jgi:glycosyltransferase involved in cell wall biosynthesis